MSVGIYIGSHEICLTALDGSYSADKKLLFSEAVLANDPASEEDPSAAVLQSLTQATSKTSLQSKNVVVALSDTESLLRYFEMTLIPEKERKNAVVYEAHKYLPFDTKDLYYDFKVVADKKAKKLCVMFVAARKKAVDYLVDFFHKSGVSRIAIEPYSVSLARLLCPKKMAANHVMMIVDIDKFGDMNVVMARNDFVFNSYSYSSLAADDASASLSAYFQNALGAIRLSNNYFSKTHKTLTLSGIIFCADTKYKDFQEVMRQEFGSSLLITSPFNKIAGVSARSSSALVATGAAMSGQSFFEKFKLNLTPKALVHPIAELTAAQERKVLEGYALKSLIAGAGIVFLVAMIGMGQLWSEQKKLKDYRDANAIKTLDNVAVLQQDAARNTQKLDFLKKFSNQRIYLTDKLSAIPKLTPANIRLTYLGLGNTEKEDGLWAIGLRLEGVITSNDTSHDLTVLNNYVRSLNENPEFAKGLGELKLTSVQKIRASSGEYTKFSLQAGGGV